MIILQKCVFILRKVKNMSKFNYGDIVTFATEKDFWAIRGTVVEEVNINTNFTVLVVIEKGKSHHGVETNGVIVRSENNVKGLYPYVWNEERFKLVKKNT